MVTLRDRAWAAAAEVCDPEVPVLTIADLGVLRDVTEEADGVEVLITPTYSGCAAMGVIAIEVELALARAGIPGRVRTVLAPAWTTDWMTDEGKAKLNEYGIAPPVARTTDGPIRIGMAVKCPRCHSLNTREITRFGSTSCKALYTCRECLEPFDYFKVH